MRIVKIYPPFIEIYSRSSYIRRSIHNNKEQFKKKTKMKYGELQGLRGLAILAVVLYHLWPKVFWNGFLGVDMFFVLSGFLMAETNLKRLTAGFSLANALNFWYRRIRRIVPLSILVVFGTWILVTKKLAIIDYKEITKEAYCAMAFLTNLCAVKETKYYFHENDIQYFKHYWSLAVEIQFYAVVPLFFAVFTRISTKVTLFIMLPIIVTASLILQTTLFIAHYPEAGFSLLFSRLWQFGAGISAFYVRKFGDEIIADVFLQRMLGGFFKVLHNHFLTNGITVVTAMIILYPRELEVSYMMIVVTVLTAIAITSLGKENAVIGEKRKPMKTALGSCVLSVWALRKLGDASFAIYVTHWMIQHCFWVMAVDFDWFNTRLVCLYTIMIVGFAVHHGIEKPLLASRHSKTSFFKALIAAYAVVVVTIYTTHDVDSHTTAFIEKFYHDAVPLVNNETAWTTVASRLNFEKSARLAIYTGHAHCGFYTRSEYSQTRDPITYGAELAGTGKTKFLVVGNSHAECALPAIEKALGKENYSELNMVAVPAVTPFPGFKHSDRFWQVKEAVDHYKPDVVMLIFKYQEDVLGLPLTLPIENDAVVMGLQETLDYLATKVETIFIPKDFVQIPRVFNIWQYAQGVLLQVYGRDYSFDETYRNEVFSDLYTRWQAIKCPKCVILDMWPAFCSNRRCSPLDITQNVPLFWDDNHVNLFGSHLMAPLYRTYFQQKGLINQ